MVHQLREDGSAGVHAPKGSPLNALEIQPPFEELHLIDIDQSKVDALKQQTTGMKHVHVYSGDANQILQNKVFPNIKYEDYHRALCILDPYGLHLYWSVIADAARSGTIEIFLNFPTLDMNRNVLLWTPENASAEDIERMNAFWGDGSWRDVAYSTSGNLFGWPEKQQRALNNLHGTDLRPSVKLHAIRLFVSRCFSSICAALASSC